MHSVRFRITAVTLTAILTCLILLGGVGIYHIAIESDKEALSRMNLICENEQLRLDSYLSSIQQSVEMGLYTANDSLRELDMELLGTNLSEKQLEKLDRILHQHCFSVEQAFRSIAEHTSGIVTYYYCINSDLGSSEHGFFLRRKNGIFERQLPLISSELDINDTQHTAWYYAPIKAGHAFWVGPYSAHFLEESSTVSYVAPVYRYGFLIGVLGMDIPFDIMTELIRDVQVYETGFLLLADSSGNPLYHPLIDSDEIVVPFNDQIDPEVLKRTTSGDRQLRYVKDGVEKQIAFSTLLNRIKLIVTVPVREINANAYKMARNILIAGALLLILYTVIMSLVVNAMTRPLKRLSEAAEQLETGNYDMKLDYSGKDEVGTLTRSFRKMRDHMRATIEGLNKEVNTDAMTGVRNKGAFEKYIAGMNQRIQDPEQRFPFGMIVMDCDNLKEINDRYGHLHGDIYLQVSCRLICHAFDHSPVFRLGGDEFCVVLLDEELKNRELLKQQFRIMTENQNAIAAEPWNKVSISAGLAVYDPKTDPDVETVLARADRAMYIDKQSHHK